jgi:hypothetical protein
VLGNIAQPGKSRRITIRGVRGILNFIWLVGYYGLPLQPQKVLYLPEQLHKPLREGFGSMLHKLRTLSPKNIF